MNEHLISGIDKTLGAIGPSSSPTNLMETGSTKAVPTTPKASPSSIPNTETQNLILESGALMCASTGTIPLSVRSESLNHDQNNSKLPNSLNDTTKNSISK